MGCHIIGVKLSAHESSALISETVNSWPRTSKFQVLSTCASRSETMVLPAGLTVCTDSTNDFDVSQDVLYYAQKKQPVPDCSVQEACNTMKGPSTSLAGSRASHPATWRGRLCRWDSLRQESSKDIKGIKLDAKHVLEEVDFPQKRRSSAMCALAQNLQIGGHESDGKNRLLIA